MQNKIAILQRMIKQRKDSYEQFVAKNRNDLAEVELAQMKVIEQFYLLNFLRKNWNQKLKNNCRSRRRISKRLRKSYGTSSKALAGKSDGKSISRNGEKNYYHN